jgi:cysteine-rich repeat protein
MKKVWLACVVACGACGSVDSGTGRYCGDGLVNLVGEQCDDGNNLDGDGCSSACLNEVPPSGGYITANWQLKSIATSTVVTCPTGYDTAALYSQPVDAAGNNTGSVVVDLYDCVANTGTSSALAPGRYLSWIEIANHTNTSVYAKSLSAFIDITTSDKTFSVQILTDGGYFQLAWSLVGATTNNSLTCAQAGATGGVEAIGTDVSNSSNSASDQFTCEDFQGVTAGYVAATYTVSVSALNGSNQSIGTAPALTNKVIQPKNMVTNLGTVSIPITGK